MSEVSAERIGRLAMKIVENVREEGEIISDEEIISDKEGADASINESTSKWNKSEEKNKELYEALRQGGLRVEEMVGDGNCFFRAVSFGVYGTDKYHLKVRVEISEYISQRGVGWEGNVEMDESMFNRCIEKLREVGNYEFVGEITILAVADIYGRKVRIYRGRWCIVYSPCNDRPGKGNEIKLGFIEPAHYVAVVGINESGKVRSCNEKAIQKEGNGSSKGRKVKVVNCKVQRLANSEAQNTDNEEKSTVGYDVNCCGVLVDRSGLITEEVMMQAVKNIADEVKLLPRGGKMYRSKCKVWVIHYRHSEREQKVIKVDKRFYKVKRFDFGLYYKEVDVIRRRKLIEGRCMWSVVNEILLVKKGKENKLMKSGNDYCNGFSVLSWNAAGWLSNGLEFGFLVSSMENPPAVMCIQESKLKGGVSCKIKGYVCYRKDKVDSLHACGGVLIFVTEEVSSYDFDHQIDQRHNVTTT